MVWTSSITRQAWWCSHDTVGDNKFVVFFVFLSIMFLMIKFKNVLSPLSILHSAAVLVREDL